jgi:hypothetical protein
MKAKNMKDWHRKVCESVNFICRLCKKDYSYACYFNEKGVNQYVTGHHVKTRKAHPELALQTENGVCVCFGCHERAHRSGINFQSDFEFEN